MQPRKTILIINALHRAQLYKGVLGRTAHEANQHGGPEYFVETIDFDSRNEGLQSLDKIAEFTASVVKKRQRVDKIYQCIDYNAGFTATSHDSTPDLIAYNKKAGLELPVFFILDGSNPVERQAAEERYGLENYSNIMKFLAGLRRGLPSTPALPSKRLLLNRSASESTLIHQETKSSPHPSPQLNSRTKSSTPVRAVLSPLPITPSSPLSQGRASPAKLRSSSHSSPGKSPSSFFGTRSLRVDSPGTRVKENSPAMNIRCLSETVNAARLTNPAETPEEMSSSSLKNNDELTPRLNLNRKAAF